MYFITIFYIILTAFLVALICFICSKIHQIMSEKKERTSSTANLDTTDAAPKDACVEKNKNPITAPERFKIKTFFQSSKAEQLIYEYLLRSLSHYYTVIPHVSLTDIFSYTYKDNNRYEYNKYKFLGYHADFVVFDKMYYPVMIIELNGGRHRTNPKTAWTDQRKKELFDHFNIPFLSLDLSKSYTDDELICLFKSKVSEAGRIVYCWHCQIPLPCAENLVCPQCQKTNIFVPPLFQQ